MIPSPRIPGSTLVYAVTVMVITVVTTTTVFIASPFCPPYTINNAFTPPSSGFSPGTNTGRGGSLAASLPELASLEDGSTRSPGRFGCSR